jgi:hypothetical protein
MTSAEEQPTESTSTTTSSSTTTTSTPTTPTTPLSRFPHVSISSGQRDRLPLYFTGTMSVIFLLVGIILLYQIINIQKVQVEMESNQNILLNKVDSDIQTTTNTFNLMKKTFEQSGKFSAENVNMTKVNAQNIENILHNITGNLLNLTNRLVDESNKNLVMFDAQNIIVDNMHRNITEINDKLTQVLTFVQKFD